MNNRNPLSEHKTERQKYRAFVTDRASGAVAHKFDGTVVSLNNINVHDVEFIGGLWRVQKPCTYTVRYINKQQIILGDKIPYSGAGMFDYYRAGHLVYNCYGPLAPKFDLVAACFVAGDETYWAYGNTTATAGATLAIRMCDEYKYLLRTFAQQRSKKKSR